MAEFTPIIKCQKDNNPNFFKGVSNLLNTGKDSDILLITASRQRLS